MPERKLTKAEDQFGCSYYYDKKSQDGITLDDDHISMDIEYDVRGFLAFNFIIINVDDRNSMHYAIQETTKNFNKISELKFEDWVAVGKYYGYTLGPGEKSTKYSRLITSGIRAVRIFFIEEILRNSVQIQVHTTGEI